MTGVRPPAVAGMFYPERPSELRREIAALLKASPRATSARTLVALVAPHAGYQYSGRTAAAAYRLLEGRSIGTVVIVSPSHREAFGGISVFDGTAYRTPLGDLMIDARLRSALLKGDPEISACALGHHREHAIEVQLPFLQSTLGNSPMILPIVMGDQRRSSCVHLGERLAEILEGTDSIMIASTDLSHYHPYQEAEAMDQAAIGAIARYDVEGLLDDLEQERVEACGGGPTAAVLFAARRLGARHVEILHHSNSGDATGDRSSVVGYLSAAITV